MRRVSGIALALLLLTVSAASSAATVATIATRSPLADHEEASVTAALREAVQTAVVGAAAMGLRWFQIRHALVLDDAVTVEIVATDENPTSPDTANSGPGPERGSGVEGPAPAEGQF
jgi:hypothetical protein